jgi:hypothetical protein
LLESKAVHSEDELLAEYRAGWDDHPLPIRFSKDHQVTSLDNSAVRMLKAFTESGFSRPAGKIIAVEETLRADLIPGLPDVLGRVDLILETEKELIMTDWKTSTGQCTARITSTSQQLSSCSMASFTRTSPPVNRSSYSSEY